MDDMAKLTSTGDGQSVDLPEGYRFAGEEVRIHREGARVVLEPADEEIDEETGLPISELRRLIQEGLDSGPAEPWDVEDILRRAREGFTAESRV